MKRNYFLSSITRPIDASNLIRSLLRHTNTILQGVMGGLEYIWARKKLMGMDDCFDSLAVILVHEANSMVSLWIARNKRTSDCLQMAIRIRFVIDSYASFKSKFGTGYEEAGLVCYFNLAELYRGNGETRKCLDSLELCESIAKTIDSRRSLPTGKLPSIQVIATCLSEVLLCHRETKRSLDKSREVILFFQVRMRSSMSDSEWTTFTYALFVHCEACIRLEDLIGVEGCLSISKQVRLQCSNYEVVLPILDRLDKAGRTFRTTYRRLEHKEDLVKNWKQIAQEFDHFLQTPPRRPKSAKSSFYRRPRPSTATRPLTVQSGDIFDVYPQKPLSVHSSPVLEVAPISHPLGMQSSKHIDIPSPFIPPLALDNTQTTHIVNSDDPWISFTSKSSGKVFFYNQISGESAWKKSYS